MQINITAFFQIAAPMDYSASVAEIGQSAGPDTWRAACDDAPDYPFLDTEEKRGAFRNFVRSSGGWSAEEIAAWSDIELGALFLQWVASDAREMFTRGRRTLDALTPEDWSAAETLQRDGSAPSNIYRGDDGAVYFCLEC